MSESVFVALWQHSYPVSVLLLQRVRKSGRLQMDGASRTAILICGGSSESAHDQALTRDDDDKNTQYSWRVRKLEWVLLANSRVSIATQTQRISRKATC